MFGAAVEKNRILSLCANFKNSLIDTKVGVKLTAI